MSTSLALKSIYDGWDGYQTSLMCAVRSLTPEQLAFRVAPPLRSVAELLRHIHVGRVNWFVRMGAPNSEALAAEIPTWYQDAFGNRYIVEEAVSLERADLLRGLEATWAMIAATLEQWSVTDLTQTYVHTYAGSTYAVSYQWTIWRILSHDIHHGGQLSLLLAIQGISIPELGDLGGHLTEPPLISP